MDSDECEFCLLPIRTGDDYFVLTAANNPEVTMIVCQFCHDRLERFGSLQGEPELAAWGTSRSEPKLSADEVDALFRELLELDQEDGKSRTSC